MKAGAEPGAGGDRDGTGPDQIQKSRKKPRAGRSRMRTGCRTCKIRRVKCDEGRPVCMRCISTGRVCDGYGVWGGGGNGYGHRMIGWPNRPSLLYVPFRSVMTEAAMQEREFLDFFTHMSSIKLPGVFPAAFWDTVVFQLCETEPAVLHAIVALGSAHKREMVGDGGARSTRDVPPDEQEEFMLQQYSKAISFLQPHLATKTKTSMRVALVTCVAFACLEFIRGRLSIGNSHLQSGLKLLEGFRSSSSPARSDDAGILRMPPSGDTVDDSIADCFARFHVQTSLFLGRHFAHSLYPVMSSEETDIPGPMFSSVFQARKQIDRLFARITRLSEECTQIQETLNSPLPFRLFESQRRVQADVESWLMTYKASRVGLQAKMDARDAFAYRLLRSYHTMAIIMADTCLSPADESVFDSHTETFRALISQALDIASTASLKIMNFEHKFNVTATASIADIGWIPPLCYTALKCRVHRIRLHAIKLLRVNMHKEGIWDSRQAATIGEEVMKLEEGDFYKGIADDRFAYDDLPEDKELLLPTLPHAYRMHDFNIVLPEDLPGRVQLVCKRRLANGSVETITRMIDATRFLRTGDQVPAIVC